MSQQYSTRAGWTVILFIILQPFLQRILCQDIFWCLDGRQEVALYAANGQNISHRFDISVFSSFYVWSKGDSKLLDFSIGDYSSERYKATTVSTLKGGHTIDLEISFATHDVSGEHVISYYLYRATNRRKVCTIGVFDLTIVSEPICSIILKQENKKIGIQMSCQWEQMNTGQKARILAGNETIYKHETPMMKIDGLNSIPNKLSFIFAPENTINARIVPNKWFVSYNKITLNTACNFIPVQDYTIAATTQIDHATINCSTSETNISWWYFLDHHWFFLNVSNTITFIDVDHVIIVCGVEDERELRVYSIGIVKFKDNQQVNMSLRRAPVNNTSNLKCEDLTLNITIETNKLRPSKYSKEIHETSTESQPSTFVVGSVDDVEFDIDTSTEIQASTFFVESVDVDSNKKSIDMEMLLLLVLVLSTLAHAVSIAAFTFFSLMILADNVPFMQF